MKITREQFDEAARMAESDHNIPSSVANRVLWSGLAAIGVEVDNSCQCSTTVREHCASNACHGGSRLIEDEHERARFSPVEDVSDECIGEDFS